MVRYVDENNSHCRIREDGFKFWLLQFLLCLNFTFAQRDNIILNHRNSAAIKPKWWRVQETKCAEFKRLNSRSEFRFVRFISNCLKVNKQMLQYTSRTAGEFKNRSASLQSEWVAHARLLLEETSYQSDYLNHISAICLYSPFCNGVGNGEVKLYWHIRHFRASHEIYTSSSTYWSHFPAKCYHPPELPPRLPVCNPSHYSHSYLRRNRQISLQNNIIQNE
jgi:hypothetical protein